MTAAPHSIDPTTYLDDLLAQASPDLMRQMLQGFINQILSAQADTVCGAEYGVASTERVNHRNGYRHRDLDTRVGTIDVAVPKLRHGAFFPDWLLERRSRAERALSTVIATCYLKGVSTGDFGEALAALLGPDAKGLSAKTVTRLKANWWSEYEAWEKRDLGTRRFLYIWADGVYFKPRMAEEKQCVLVIVGADEYGRKELLAMTDGFRESTQSWREVLLDLKRRGLTQDPKLAIGDGALGFWTALREVFPTTQEQRCWLHKTMNVLNALPKSAQARAKGHLHDIWQAGTKAEANVAFNFFVETYGVKWDKAVAKLVKDRDALLTLYDYPAEHWKHIRTSNPIESTFATVRHRTRRTKGCLSRKTGLAMAFRLMMSAQKKWRRLDGRNRLPEVISGVEFRDGVRHIQAAA